MISRGMAFALLVAVFAPGTQYAQQTPLQQHLQWVQSYGPKSPPSQAVLNHDKMYEDIEILRRILDRKLDGLYPTRTYTTFGMIGMQGGMGGGGLGGLGGLQGGLAGLSGQGNFQGGMGGFNQLGMQGGMSGFSQLGGGGLQGGMGMAGGMMPVTMPIPSLEGVYLKGQGIVYTATLSSLESTAKAETAKKPVTEWERVRQQLRNETEEPDKPEAGKPLALSDLLLKVLAENGHHFAQLGENESLTIVLTVHEADPSSPDQKSGGGTRKGSPAKKKSKPVNPGGGSGSDRQRGVRDLQLLGELHQKQGHYEEALSAFQRAAAHKPGPSPKEMQKVYRRMAQCYLALEQDEKAQKMLDHVNSFLEESADVKDKPAAALPIKLIISAPKKLLDEIKVGRISFEEFRRRASVETLRFENHR